jgi:hypothetical protein
MFDSLFCWLRVLAGLALRLAASLTVHQRQRITSQRPRLLDFCADFVQVDSSLLSHDLLQAAEIDIRSPCPIMQQGPHAMSLHPDPSEQKFWQ